MDALLVLIHWLHLLALALWIGGLAALAIVLPATPRLQPEDGALLEPARRRTQVLLWWAVIALMLTLAVEIGLRTLAISHGAGTTFTTSLRAVLFGTRYGEASVARWLILVASLWTVDELARAPVATGRRGVRTRRSRLTPGCVWRSSWPPPCSSPRPSPDRTALLHSRPSSIPCASALSCSGSAAPS
jgi:putative copper export protein